jgi:hypothetical protein
MADDSNTKMIVIVVLGLIALYVVYTMSQQKENFAMTNQKDYVGNYMMSPPNLGFGAPLAPRMDGQNVFQNSLLGQTASSNMGAVPPQPVMMNAGAKVDFKTMGGADSMPYGALSSSQAGQMLDQRVGGGKPEMIENVLPLGDINQLSMDPTDPNNFLADRTIFSKLKRQYGNQVDFIRGDIDVTQEYRGWFDVRPATEKDIVTGYFDRYLDIQQYTALRDAQFTRATPIQNLYASAQNEAGNIDRLAYTRV